MDWKSMTASFVAVFLAELGDKTQLAALLLASKSKTPISVFIGAGAALLASTAIAVSFGYLGGKAIPGAIIGKIAGVVFIGIGVLLLVGKI